MAQGRPPHRAGVASCTRPELGLHPCPVPAFRAQTFGSFCQIPANKQCVNRRRYFVTQQALRRTPADTQSQVNMSTAEAPAPTSERCPRLWGRDCV